MGNTLKNLSKFSWRERFLFPEAIFWLGATRFVILVLPFKWVKHWLAQRPAGPSQTNEQQLMKALRVGKVVRSAARHLPWQCLCLVQALSAKSMLLWRRVPTNLFIGIGRDEQDSFNSHAWLCCGQHFITGQSGHERFQVITCFGEE